jgi:ABC-type oligopeptide transport system substrate-binding subunit
MLIVAHPDSTTTLDMRNDVKPFNDIRVRKAMQMAIDLPTIARNYYGGAIEPYPSSITSWYMKGWAWPFEQWPQDLKD